MDDLDVGDLERLAVSAYLAGKDEHADATWARAHHALIDAGSIERAARCGFWLCLSAMLCGDYARGAGWLARTERLLERAPADCVERGYILLPTGLMAMGRGDPEGATRTFERVIAVAAAFSDPDLMTLGLLGSGQARIRANELARGVTLLDEAMVAMTAGEVAPMVAGIVYCAVILTCRRIDDLERALEWTKALHAWCDAQPDLVAYRGPCLVHRAELLQLRGEWSLALDEAARASALFAARTQPFAGRALYRRAEIHRLRGELDRAESLYREAAALGFEPQPGLALLWLEQNNLDAARAAIVRVAAERSEEGRAQILAALVDIMLAGGDLDGARAGSEELSALAEARNTTLVRALDDHARGALLTHEGDAQEALTPLRRAWTSWQRLGAPYESARVRVLIAGACDRLGDADTARMHLDQARGVFTRLGAARDLARLADEVGAAEKSHPLSPREIEVLSLVAGGDTNRQIAALLAISEHTVARHMSNIFNKLGVTTRTAATSWALARELI